MSAQIDSSDRNILLIDDDPGILRRVEARLREVGYRVTALAPRRSALEAVDRLPVDAVLLGLDGSLKDAASWVLGIKKRAPSVPVLLMATADRITQAIEALRLGADEYLLRPPDPIELRVRLGGILERNDFDSKLAFFQDELSKKSAVIDPENQSPAMRAVVERVRRVSPMRSTVLVIGESGVGKELVARSIHFHSPRRSAPFIALNCAAMPGTLIESDLFGHEKGAFTGAHVRTRGKFEIANHGTLFLDEIGEMDPPTQAKLLRVLEEREFMRLGGGSSIRVDVRLIAATNADLEDMVARNLFRRDLYYRLKVVTIRVPPLRERRQDIPKLIDTFLDQLARANAVPRKRIDEGATRLLRAYAWPGNVRELKNILESVLVSTPGDTIRAEDLPPALREDAAGASTSDLSPGSTLEDMEQVLIRRTLEYTGGNRTHAAHLLGIGVRTLQRKVQRYGIDIAPKRRRPRERLSTG